MPALGRILIADDEVELMSVLRDALTRQGYEAHGVTSGAEALAVLGTGDYDVLLTDLMMPGMDGINLLRQSLIIDPSLVGILMTGQGTVPTAVEAMQTGAFDYLLKPFKIIELAPIIARAMDVRRLRLDSNQLGQAITLFDMSQVISLALDIQAIAEKTIDLALQQSAGDESAILLFTEARDELYVAAVRGNNRIDLLGQRVPLGAGIAGWLAEHDEVLILNGAIEDPRFAALYPRTDIVSALAIPMLAGGKVMGVLTINALHRHRPYSRGQVKVLSILATIAAAALANATLYTAVARNEERFRMLIENSADAITLLSADGIVVYDSPASPGLLGYNPGELIGQNVFDLMHPEDRVMINERFAQVLQRPAEKVRAIFRYRHKNGTWRWIEAVATNLLAEPSIKAIVLNYHDITDRRQAELTVLASEERFQLVTRATNDAIWDWDLVSDNLWLNDLFFKIFGWTLAGFEPGVEGWSKRIHPDDVARVLEGIQGVIHSGGDTWSGEYLFRRGDGTYANVLDRGYVVRDASGQSLRMLGAMMDITERKQRERELEAIAHISAALRTTLAPTDMQPIIIDQAMRLFNAEAALLVTINPATGEGRVEAARGAWASRVGDQISPEREADAQVFSIGKAYLTYTAAADSVEIKSTLSAPLMAQGETMGEISLGRKVPWTEADQRLLVAIADMAASAWQRASLFEQTQRRLKHLQALRAVDETITGSLDMRLILNVLLDQISAHLRVDAVDILLLNVHTQTLNYFVGHGFRTNKITRSLVKVGEGHAGRVALERRSVYIPDNFGAGISPARAAILAGEGFAAYYGVPLIAKGQVKGVLEIFHREPFTVAGDWLEFLDSLAGQAAIAIDNTELFKGLQRSSAELLVAYDTTLLGWSKALDLRDKETEGHTQRVTEITVNLARASGLSEPELLHVRRGALLHDVGKLGIPDSILLKPGPLTEAEWVVMRQHPTYVFEWLSPIAYLRPALDIPWAHHEKWDGTGYPRGLRGAEIPLAARIFAVVDVWDALRSDRPYRQAWPEEKVLEHIRTLAGTHFDPQVVKLFLDHWQTVVQTSIHP